MIVARVQAATTRAGGTSRSGAQAAPADSEPPGRATSQQLAQQLIGARDSFDTLLSTFKDPLVEDIDNLGRWSFFTLEAEQWLAKTDADRVAVYQRTAIG